MDRNRLIVAALCAVQAIAMDAGAACTAGNPNLSASESTPSSAFTIHGDGTATHNLSGLMWKQCAQGLSGTGCANGTATTMTWSAALKAAVADTSAGHDDWRLPNRKELQSIVEMCGYGPAINQNVFPGTPASGFWSGSSYVPDPANAWYVHFDDGNTGADVKTLDGYVRLVRGGQSFDSFDRDATAGVQSSTTPSSTANPAVYGQSVTYSVTVSGSGGTPTGSVSFTDGGSALCSSVALVAGRAACAAGAQTVVGTHFISALYSGDAGFSTSTGTLTQAVNKAGTSLAITGNAPNPATTQQPVTVAVNLSVAAPGAGSPAGTITVGDGSVSCGIAWPGSSSCALQWSSAGAKTLTATYAGNGNFAASTSAGASQTVGTGAGAPVIEFYNSVLDNYFITADANEAAAVDSGGAGPYWARTGNTFSSGGATAVCRFYGSQSPGPNSHFYTIDPAECQDLKNQQATTPATQKRWNFESNDFLSTRPTSGACPAGTNPVYRAYNNGFARGVDSNHRIVSDSAALQQVLARGWANEGVVMCAPPGGAALNCAYALGTPSGQALVGGGNLGVQVTATSGCGWSAASNDGWIAVTGGATGSGNGTVNLTVSANQGASARTGTLSIAGQKYTVNQAGAAPTCTYALSVPSQEIGAAGGPGSVAVFAAAGCGWTAASNDGWIAVTGGATGSGNGTVSLTVSANQGAAARTGTLRIAGQTYTVNQAAAAPSCTYALSAPSLPMGAAGGPGSVAVFAAAGCSWSAVSNAPWIRITSGAAGSGNGAVNFAVAANTDTVPLVGTITIAGIAFQITVSGADKPPEPGA